MKLWRTFAVLGILLSLTMGIVSCVTPTPIPTPTSTVIPTETPTYTPTLVPTITPTSTPTSVPTITPIATPTPTVEPTGAVPYGAIWFGMNENDYNQETLKVFSGAFLSLWHSGGKAEALLDAAKQNGLKVKIGVGEINPCRYWNNITFTFDYNLFMSDSKAHIALAAKYYPDTVVMVSLLNEPHWINNSTATCFSGIPPKYLYNLVKMVRKEFASNGITDRNLLIGVNSHPGYINSSIGFPKYIEPPEGGQLTEEEKSDGTINLLWIYYHNSNDLSWAHGQQVIARKYGWKIIYNTNASKAGLELVETGKWHCAQEDAVFVTWWSWAVQNQQVPISSLISVREACNRNQ